MGQPPSTACPSSGWRGAVKHASRLRLATARGAGALGAFPVQRGGLPVRL